MSADQSRDVLKYCQELAEALKCEYSWIAPDKLYSLFLDTCKEHGVANKNLSPPFYTARQLVMVSPIWSVKIAIMLNLPHSSPSTGAPWFIRDDSTKAGRVEELMVGFIDWITSAVPPNELLEILASKTNGGYVVTAIHESDISRTPQNGSYQ
jgi:hypothetical protein